jgi:hypothetical protein
MAMAHAVPPQPTLPPAFVGARWAAVLAAAVVIGVAASAALRWRTNGRASETIVELPVTAADLPAKPPDLTAPEPTDDQ